jgi:hypothetical protein
LRNDRAMQRRRETVGERVRENDENTHRAIASAVAAGVMLTSPEPGVSRGRKRCAEWCSWATASSS